MNYKKETMDLLRPMMTKKGKLTAKAEEAVNKICNMKPNCKYYLKQWRRNGRYFRIEGTLYINVTKIFDLLEILYDEGNDSPRGGINGEYIILNEYELNKAICILKGN